MTDHPTTSSDAESPDVATLVSENDVDTRRWYDPRWRSWWGLFVYALPVYLVSRLCVIAGAAVVAAELRVDANLADEQNLPLADPHGTANAASAARPILDVMTSWDGLWYLDIVRSGYPDTIPADVTYHVDEARAAFFPLFPLLARWFDRIVPGGDTIAALVMNGLLGMVAVVLIGLLARRLYGDAVARLTVVLVALFPGSFVLSFAYSEALMIVLAAACLLMLVDHEWVAAGLFAALATATRPNGLALVLACFVAAVVAIRERREWGSLVAVALAPLGFITFQVWLGNRTGEAGVWFRVQREAWNEGASFGLTAIKNTVEAVSQPLTSPTDTITALSVVATVVLVTMAWKVRLELVPAAYSFAIVALMLTPSTVTARPRFLFTAFPLLIAAARWYEPRRHRGDDLLWPITLGCCGAGLAALTGLYGVFGADPVSEAAESTEATPVASEQRDEDSTSESPRRRGVGWHPLLLAALAFVPALTASPGRMPADSKLYLYLDPGRLMSDAAGSFDPRQFGGWVPHQHISFLWPSGPWFWLFDLVGVPDWIAHRLWLGTIMLIAGLGVRWCSRQLGMAATPALVAAVVYQVAPYVLPYVSRTSVMLLPWAGVGWIVGLTVRASRDRGWRDPALIALVVLTVGAVNATALAMIVPAPALWLVHAVWARLTPWREAAIVAARTALLSVAVSLWWIVALLVQGRYGTDVLPYSESLADVSHTSTSPEVWRGLGYWLFYIRDPFAPTTTESLRYLSSTPSLVISFAVPLMCLAGVVWVRWVHRRFAILLVAVGFVLAVGVHPSGGRSPLMKVLTDDGDGGLALALRSSTRALPVMQLGLALAAGSLVAASAHLRWRGRWLDRGLAVLVCGLALANQPGLVTGAWVDPALDRDESPPDAWLDAADALDASDGDRVLMLPGAEFGAYRWGYTVDQPLPGLTERPVVTRDLLPLGSPSAMDLLYAFDDRFQHGVAEPESIATVARLFAADTIWLTNDQAFDRFRTARPEVVRDTVFDADAVGDVTSFGESTVNRSEVPMVDDVTLGDARVGVPLAPVELVALDVAAPLTRSYARTIAIIGSGDGIVDAAAAGLLPHDVGLRYAADQGDAAPTDVGQIVTDSNRRRARHWRSSQDTTGFTESIDGGVLVDVPSDTRLPVFAEPDPHTVTTAEQRGPVAARATGYGEPFAYLPEHRPFMAIDGDPATAWLVGEHGDPIGETIELRFPGGSPGAMHLLQPSEPTRRVTEIEIVEGDDGSLDESTRRRLSLDLSSTTSPGQTVQLAGDTTRAELTITAVGGGVPGTAGAVAGVGFSEIDIGRGPTREVVVPPAPDRSTPTDFPTAWVFTRERVDPADRWRSDPETTLSRELALTSARRLSIDYTVRVDQRAPDTVLAELFGWPVAADSRLAGSIRHAGVAAFDGDPSTTWTTSFDGAIGATISIDDAPQPIRELRVTQPVNGFSTATEIEIRSGDVRHNVALEPGADGGATVRLDPPIPAGEVEIEITSIDEITTTDRRHGDQVALPVAVSEIAFDGAPRVMTLGASDHEFGCRTIATIDGAPLAAAMSLRGDGWLDNDPVVARPCRSELVLPDGDHDVQGVRGAFALDRIVFDSGLTEAVQQADDGTAPVVLPISEGRYGGRYSLSDCPAGCVFVFGEGHNDGWSATLDGVSLGAPRIVDGGFNGWWIPPTQVPVELEVTWTARRPLEAALIASALFALLAAAVAVRARRPSAPGRTPIGLVLDRPPLTRGEAGAATIVWIVAGFALIGPSGALWGAVGGAVAWWSLRRDLAALTSISTVLAVGAYVVVNERRWAPLPNGGWPVRFEAVHDVGMFAVVALFVAAVISNDRTPRPHEPPAEGAP